MRNWLLTVLCWASALCLPAHAQTVTYVHTDALGSPVVETDANRNVVERNEYEPYGRSSQPLDDGPGYTGHVGDAATGLIYAQQRYYDDDIGRFLSVDPVSIDGSTVWNFCRYCYAANNPYKFTDPDGRQASINYNQRWEKDPATGQLRESAAWRYANQYQNKPGEISVIGHSDNSGFYDERSRQGNDANFHKADADQVSGDIAQLPEYGSDSTITLLGCRTAEGDNSLAEQIHNKLPERNSVTGSPDRIEARGPNFRPFTDLNGDHQKGSNEPYSNNWKTFPKEDPKVEP